MDVINSGDAAFVGQNVYVEVVLTHKVEQVFKTGIDVTHKPVCYVEVYCPDDGIRLVLFTLRMYLHGVCSIKYVLSDKVSQVMAPCHTCKIRKYTCKKSQVHM